jgi:hypothetical protein
MALELKLDGFSGSWPQVRVQRAILVAQPKGFHRCFPDLVGCIADLQNDTVIEGDTVPLDKTAHTHSTR